MVAFAGFISAAFAVLFFGSNYTVVAKYDAGDGMLFQLVLCLGIWVTGLVVLVMRGSPAFYPVAMCGGVLWGTGNCMSAYIIRRTGLGLGLVTWGSTALIIGWLTGFFGLFGLPSEQRCLDQPWLNVVGGPAGKPRFGCDSCKRWMREEDPSSEAPRREGGAQRTRGQLLGENQGDSGKLVCRNLLWLQFLAIDLDPTPRDRFLQGGLGLRRALTSNVSQGPKKVARMLSGLQPASQPTE
ncbi:unnamed protein product [Effrenium voratum]|uniref:Transmembrane protein 144 n=1 Tax=Effrenium voratum TaxID=2562239 RepID=A0AA36IZM3_9DINO|nr:unnamed protein product [Effrenium voratum]